MLEQAFTLKEYGNLSLFEQCRLTHEDRVWWIKRLNKKAEDEKKQASGAQTPGG